MSFATTTIDVTEFVKIAEAAPAEHIRFVHVPTPEGKTFKATPFNMEVRLNKESKFSKVLFYGRGLYVVRPPYDPTTSTVNTTNPQEITFDISGNHAGDYIKLIELVNKERDLQIKAMKGKKGVAAKIDTEKYHPMTNDVYSEKSHKDYAGTAFKDPLDSTKTDLRIKIKVDFSAWAGERISENLRGKSKCTIKNFLTGRLNETTGQIEYDDLLYEGKPIDASNAHLVLTKGTVIEEYYITLEKSSHSNLGITTSQLATNLVVTPAQRKERNIEVRENIDLLARIKAKQAAAKEAADKENAEATQAATNLYAVIGTISRPIATNAAPAPTLKDLETHLNNAVPDDSIDVVNPTELAKTIGNI